MKPIHFAIILTLCVVPVAQASVGLQATSLDAAGDVEGLPVRLLDLQATTGATPWPTGTLQLEAVQARIEVLLERSTGTPVAVDPTTERIAISNGSVAEFSDLAGQDHQLFVRAAENARLEGLPFVGLGPHSSEEQAFPTTVVPTGDDPPTDLRDTSRVTDIPNESQVTIHSPFMLILWNWNITYATDGETHSLWSGARPHGVSPGGIAVQGRDSQLIVIHVEEGSVSMPLRRAEVERFYVADEEFSVRGSLSLSNAEMVEDGRRTPKGSPQYYGNLSVRVGLENAERLHVTLGLPGDPADGPPGVSPGGNAQDAAHEPAGTSTGPPDRDRMLLVLLTVGVAITMMGAVLAIRTMQWRSIRKTFNAGDYARVAHLAGRFHGSRIRGGDAQTMTLISALKLGHHELVLRVSESMHRIEPTVRHVIDCHALVALGHEDAARQLLKTREMRDNPQRNSKWLDAIEDHAGRAYS